MRSASPRVISPSPSFLLAIDRAQPLLFWRNAKPINPSTTKTAPATINQCGYSIAESIRHFPFAFRPPHLDFGE
jgi:hypothetical protein